MKIKAALLAFSVSALLMGFQAFANDGDHRDFPGHRFPFPGQKGVAPGIVYPGQKAGIFPGQKGIFPGIKPGVVFPGQKGGIYAGQKGIFPGQKAGIVFPGQKKW